MIKKCALLLLLTLPTKAIGSEVTPDTTSAKPDTLLAPPQKKRYSKDDVEWLAKVMYHEARGEGDKGMLATGLVTLNRVKSKRFPKTVKAVILQRNQFSWVGKGYGISDKNKWNRAKQLSVSLLEGTHPSDRHLDLIAKRRYLFFHVKSLGRHKDSVIYGNHVFYGAEA